MLARKAPSPPLQAQPPTFNLSADLPFYSTSLDDSSVREEDRALHGNDQIRGGGANEKAMEVELPQQRLEEAEVAWETQAMEWMRMKPPHQHQPSPPQHHQQLQRLVDGIIDGPFQEPLSSHGLANGEEDSGPAMDAVEGGERQEEGSAQQKLRRS